MTPPTMMTGPSSGLLWRRTRSGSEPRSGPRGEGCRSTLGALLVGLGLALGPGPAGADAGVEWGKRALLIQNQIDFATPFHNTFWVGTHNSFNARDWGYSIDPNQKRTPQDQLASGASELTYDVYWSADSMKLCHGTCGAGDKTFRQGLDQIRDFLGEHPEAVVMLKLEVTGKAIDGQWSKLADQLDGAVGARLYTPADAGESTGCQTLNPAKITKRAILEKGKNLLVLVTPQPDHGCVAEKQASWNGRVFTGFKINTETTSGGVTTITTSTTFKFKEPKDSADCKAKREDGARDMLRVHDGHTWRGIADGNDTNTLTPSSYRGYMAAGLNLFELFNFNGDGGDTSYSFLKPQDLVWSWKEGQPNGATGAEDCAVVDAGGRFDDVPCDEVHRFACFDGTTRRWSYTAAGGPFSGGEAKCQQLGANYSFATPVNPYESQQLVSARSGAAPALAAGEAVWVNYQDLSVEGTWVANASARASYARVAALGGTGGDGFDDLDQLKIDLYRASPRSVTRVSIRAGARVDAVGLGYSDGRTVLHGGSGGTEQAITFGSGEWINGYTVCYDRERGSDRVFFLRFTTNTGRKLEGGKSAGKCIDRRAEEGQRLFALHGRSGDGLDAIGAYFRAAAVAKAP